MPTGSHNKIGAFALVLSACAAQADIAYVTAQNANAVSVLDLTTGQTRQTLSVPGKPAGVQIIPALDRVFTVSPDDKTVRAFSLHGTLLGKITLDGAPIGIAATQEALFVSDWFNARIWVIDPIQLTVQKTLQTGAAPAGLAVSPDGAWLASADRDADQLSIFALPHLEQHKVIPVGKRPFAVTFDPQGRVFATNVGSNSVSVVDPNTGAVLADLPTGKRPYGVAFAAGRIFVSNQYDDSVSVFTSDFQPLAKLEVGEYPEGIAAFDHENRILVVNWMSNTATVIDAATLDILTEIDTADGPRAFGQFILEDPR